MSLITRCPACSTSFKVVADQLKVSGGWVRCGHCSEVFDAQAYLQPEGLAPGLVQPRMAPEPDGPIVAAPPPRPAPPAAPAKKYQSPVPEADAPAEPSPPPPAAEPVAPDSLLQDSVSPLPDVSFVRKARAQAFWRRPMVRGSLALLCLVLVAALAAQVAVFERDRIAATDPRAKPWLLALCQLAGCELAPYRQIDALVIDSTAFNKLRTDIYRLTVVIKNTGPLELAMPALDLALTDTQDQPVLRRVLQPDDFGAKPVLAANAEFSGVAILQVDKLAVAGYRVLAFYP